ncbi:MAG: hypothetical protein KDA95_11675 [Acidimicrobiales bacterium]|nr:hypothetical protein [Acidimicrobiales bacterium]
MAKPTNSDRPEAPPALTIPSISDMLNWSASLTGEVMRLPATAAKARHVVAVLPEHLVELISALDRFTELLEGALGEVRDEVHDVGARLEVLQVSIDALAQQLKTTTSGIDEAMPVLSTAVVRLEDRLEGMDTLLNEFGGTVVGTINAVPGLRRIGKRTPTSPS